MRGKTCLITGANAGIGFETAAGLAERGARVLMVCRNPGKGEAARREILSRVPGAELELITADLATVGSVQSLAAEVDRSVDRLDVLISNAGRFSFRRETTGDGLEATFAVNHVAPFVLVNGLLGLLRRSAPSRVVVVASDAHFSGTIRFENLQTERRYSGWKAYTQSKLANVLFANELARRLPPAEVTVNSLHPGVVGTKLLLRGIIPAWFARPLAITPAMGARTSIYVASSPDLVGVTGAYFDDCREKEPSDEARDTLVASRLWDETQRIVDATTGET